MPRPSHSSSRKSSKSNNKKQLFKLPTKKKTVCTFTEAGLRDVDYMDVTLLQKYLNDDYKINPIRYNSVSARMQRRLTTAIKRARFLALIPYTTRHKNN